MSTDDYFVKTGNNSAVHGSGRISYNEEFSFDAGNDIGMCDKISVDYIITDTGRPTVVDYIHVGLLIKVESISIFSR